MIRILVIFLSMLLAGCGVMTAIKTPYQNMGMTGGLVVKKTSPISYNIRSGVNPNTAPQKATDYAMLKAAELAKEKGFTHFKVVNIVDKTKSLAKVPQFSSDYKYVDGKAVLKPEARGKYPVYQHTDLYFDIDFLNLNPDQRPSGKIYNADHIIARIGPTVKRGHF